MQYFADQGGRFVFKHKGSGLQRRLVLIVAIGTMVAVGAAMFLYMYSKAPQKAEDGPMWMFALVPLITVPSLAVLLFVLRGRLGGGGSITVDYPSGSVRFYEQTPRGYRRVDLSTDEIRGIVLTQRRGYAPGQTTESLLWMVRLNTTEGEHDVLRTADGTTARGVAAELSSLISSPVQDLST